MALSTGGVIKLICPALVSWPHHPGNISKNRPSSHGIKWIPYIWKIKIWEITVHWYYYSEHILFMWKRMLRVMAEKYTLMTVQNKLTNTTEGTRGLFQHLIRHFNSLAPERPGCHFKTAILNLVYWLISSHRLRTMPWDECQGTSPMISQQWFR